MVGYVRSETCKQRSLKTASGYGVRDFQMSRNRQGSTHSRPMRNENNIPVRASFCLLNIRSVNNKTTVLTGDITDNDFDIVALTETWLAKDDTVTCGEITPDSYTLYHVARKSKRSEKRGGGVALMVNSGFCVRQSVISETSSFERVSPSVSSGASCTRIVVIHRPPRSRPATSSRDLSSMLDILRLDPTDLLLIGDFNYLVDNDRSPTAVRLRELLAKYGLERHIHETTHRCGHTWILSSRVRGVGGSGLVSLGPAALRPLCCAS